MHRYTVSELTTEIGSLLAGEFGDVLVEGEVSGFKVAGSGHWYFALKDAGAVLNCAMFRQSNFRVRPPREGDRVQARGAVDVYAPRGSYSLVVRRLEPVGEGDLLKQLAALKAKLAAEGLFDPAKKRPLPRYPRAVGIATSPTGAALHDLVRVLRQRYPAMTVYLAPCRVQGEGAAAEIAAAVDRLCRHGRSDVIVVGRGGGAAEDLAAFNEEAVVRAIARATLPVVSAVGHEVDVTLADLAADVRAATPSHAAELVAPDAAALAAWVDEAEGRLVDAARRRVARERDRLLRTRLVHPRDRVERARARCADLAARLAVAGRALGPRRRDRFAPLPGRLDAAVRRLAQRRRDRLAAATQRLDALSPLRVLDRGYALVEHAGRPVADAATLRPGDALALRFARGAATATVTSVTATDPSASAAPPADPRGSPG